jgi:hypothetical protein
MHIEVRQVGRHFNWCFRNKGRLTAFNDPAPTRRGAFDRSRNIIKAAFKEADEAPVFSAPVWNPLALCWIIRWH